MIKELCIEDLAMLPQVMEKGFQRIELCARLDIGGITPDKQTIQRCQQLAKAIPIMVLIRPRGGDFVYSEVEINNMLKAIRMVKSLNVAGIVIGCLTRDGCLDEYTMTTLVKAAYGLDITLHMAFDDIATFEEQKRAIRYCADCGISRILTHGGSMNEPIETHLAHLQALIEFANPFNLTIMPGGGVTAQNLPELSRKLATNEFHGTKIV